MNIWKDIKYLNNEYKRLVNNYFLNKSGKFKIENNILYINFEEWGIEKFYFENNYDYNNENLFYKIIYDNFKLIHNIGVTLQIGNWDVFRKMEHYLHNFENILSFLLRRRLPLKRLTSEELEVAAATLSVSTLDPSPHHLCSPERGTQQRQGRR